MPPRRWAIRVEQACNDDVCFPPTTEKLTMQLELDVIDVPSLGMHTGHGQREAAFSGAPHTKRLMLRKLQKIPSDSRV
jgi:hypothetical protein